MLLKIRSEYIKWIDTEIKHSSETEMLQRCRGRHDLAVANKAEMKTLEDARYVFLKIIDGELRGTVEMGKGL